MQSDSKVTNLGGFPAEGSYLKKVVCDENQCADEKEIVYQLQFYKRHCGPLVVISWRTEIADNDGRRR